jgi:5,5'-dehydrodivanillate O-demethylase
METREDTTDFVHIGPGTLAGRYLRRFWTPVYPGRELAIGKAKRLQIFGEHFTLYRGHSGTPFVIADRCAHRSTQMSVGRIEGDKIRCFYHGWKYDGHGQCTEAPAEREGFCATIKMAAYPTREYLGMIFAYLGEGEVPEFPRYPVLEDESQGVLWADMDPVPIPHNYFQRIENATDEVHIMFAHGDLFNTLGLTDLPDVRVTETEYGVLQEGIRGNGSVKTAHFHMPTMNFIQIPPGPEELGWALFMTWRVAVDDTSYRSFSIRRVKVNAEVRGQLENSIDFRAHWSPLPKSLNHAVEYAQKIVAGEMSFDDIDKNDRRLLVVVQDNVAILAQGAMVDRSVERLGRSDIGTVLVRRIWERELKALAEGRPLKQWRHPDGILIPKTGLPEAAE